MNEQDWTLHNAYDDGELEPARTEMLSARLRREPALAAGLDRIPALKSRLAGLQTASGRRSGQAPMPKARIATMGFAESLLIAGLFGFAELDQPVTTEPGTRTSRWRCTRTSPH